MIAGHRTRPLTMAERMKLKPPRSEPQVNNVKVQMPLHYPDTLDPLVLRDSEANEHVEPRPVPETPAGYTGQNIRLTDGPILDAPPRRMPYADEEPEPNTDQPTPKQANWAPILEFDPSGFSELDLAQ